MCASCYLNEVVAPVRPSICFKMDLRPSERRERPSIRCLHPAYLVARATRKLLLGSACSVCASVPSLITDPNDADLRGALAQALLALDSDFAAWLQLKSRNTVSHWRPWLFFRRSRPSQAALGAGGQSRREGLAVASGAGGTGAGWGEAQVAAASALVLALFSLYTGLTPNLVGDSGSGVVVHGRCSCGWAQTAPKGTAEAHQRKWSRRG